MNGYRKSKPCLVSPEPEKMSSKLVTQPNCALSLRDIMKQFSQGEVSVRAHIPTNDLNDFQSDEEFDKSGTFPIPENFEDDFEAREFVLNQKQIIDTTEEFPGKEQEEQKQEQNQEQKPETTQEKGDEK